MSWQVMLEGEKNIPTVEPELLDEIENENMRMLEELKDIQDDKFIIISEELIKNHPQTNLISILVEMLFQEENDIDEDEKGMIFVFLKIIIESLQRSAETLNK